MCGRDVMSIRGDGTPLKGCSANEHELCLNFASTLVGQAGAVIAGKKPAALFMFRPCTSNVDWAAGELTRQTLALIDLYANELPALDVRLELVSKRPDRLALLVWRNALVDEVLSDGEKNALLADAGFDTRGPEPLMASFARRLEGFYRDAARCGFPHEMGLVFGYPLEDVLGFMAGGEVTCRGPWRAYGDVVEARRRFEAISSCERSCRRGFRSGMRLETLFAR